MQIERNEYKKFLPIKISDVLNKFDGIRKASEEEIYIYSQKEKIKKHYFIIELLVLFVLLLLMYLSLNKIFAFIFFIFCLFTLIRYINKNYKKNISIKNQNVYVADCDIYKKGVLPGNPDCDSPYYIMVCDKKQFYIKKKIVILDSEGVQLFRNPENYYFKLFLFADYNIIDCLCFPINKIENIKSNTNMFAIIGFILSFIIIVPYIPFLGLILSLIGLKKSKVLKNGKALSIAGIIISLIILLLLFIIK